MCRWNFTWRWRSWSWWCRWNFMCRETSKHGPGLLPTKRKFHLPIPTFQGDFAVGFREGKTFRVIQTMHYYNGNPSRKTIDDSSQNRSPSKFHDHSCRFFPTIPSIKRSKRILANGFFWGEDDIVDGHQIFGKLTSLRSRLFIPLFARVWKNIPGGWPCDSWTIKRMWSWWFPRTFWVFQLGGESYHWHQGAALWAVFLVEICL